MSGDTKCPSVSIITIFLNAERFLEEAIESVLAQSFADLELILVDDGSTDRSTAIAQAYASRPGGRICWTEHPGHVNRGMSASRNWGLRCARGAYVAFIDADDVWAPNKLAEQVAILDAKPDVAMVCGAVRYWRSWQGGEDAIVTTGHAANRVVFPPEATLALYPLGKAAAPCPSDLLLRRAVVERVAGFEEHFTGPRQMYEDQAFLAKLYLVAPVYFSSNVWLNYRQHDRSCVAEVTRTGQYDEVRRYFLDWFEAYLTKQPLGTQMIVRPALRRAQRRYRHPRVFALTSGLKHRFSHGIKVAWRLTPRPLTRLVNATRDKPSPSNG